MASSGTYRSKKTGRLESYDSSYELRRFEALDKSPFVKSWTKNHGIRIRYKEGRKNRTYIPDILVEFNNGSKRLEEVKGHVFDRMNFVRKNIAAGTWCAFKNIKFVIIRREQLDVVEYLPLEES